MQVEFLQDFQGVETREVSYKKGQVVELRSSVASLLLERNIVKVAKVAGERTRVKAERAASKKKDNTEGGAE